MPTNGELVRAIESSLHVYPPIPGKLEPIAVAGVRARVTPISHALANLVGMADLAPDAVDATVDRLRAPNGPRCRGYFAYVDARPVAWSFLVYLDAPFVLLGGAGTLPEHRGRGLYTALVARRLADACADGRTAAVIQADRETSAPICAKLGFRELCGLELFVGPKQA